MHMYFIEHKCFNKYQIFFIECKYILLTKNFKFATFQQPYIIIMLTVLYSNTFYNVLNDTYTRSEVRR